MEADDADLIAATTCGNTSRRPWQTRIAAAHGPPVDIWTTGADGTDLRKLADLDEDDPSVGWLPEGWPLAVVGTCGLHLLPLSEDAVDKIAPGALLSQMDWR